MYLILDRCWPASTTGHASLTDLKRALVRHFAPHPGTFTPRIDDDVIFGRTVLDLGELGPLTAGEALAGARLYLDPLGIDALVRQYAIGFIHARGVPA